MDRLINTVLKDTPPLQEIVDRRIWPRGALGTGEVPAEPELPYILYGELPSQPHQAVRETSRATDHYFQFFVYDKLGSFVRINLILDILRETVSGLSGQRSPSGALCLEGVWQGASQNMPNNEEKKGVKFGTAKLTASR